ncbi:MAG: endonuclease [Patescibacteria group bacterium]
MSKYASLIEAIFKAHYNEGVTSFEFTREEIIAQAKRLRIALPKNVGDVIYSFRYRKEFPASILSTCGENEAWVIEGIGKAKYLFRKTTNGWIEPELDHYQIKIPDATPEIIERYALSDEQALLAKVRYNRLIDTFLGITTYSLQNHLRTQVKGIGQIEVDELYVGINKDGTQFIIPVQAKGGNDKIGVVQIRQDIRFCAERYPQLVCRPVAVQFKGSNVIAMFLLELQDEELRMVDERHYKLVPNEEITDEELRVRT